MQLSRQAYTQVTLNYTSVTTHAVQAYNIQYYSQHYTVYRFVQECYVVTWRIYAYTYLYVRGSIPLPMYPLEVYITIVLYTLDINKMAAYSTRIYPTAHVCSEVYITIVLYTLDINKMAAYSTRIYPTAHVSSEVYIYNFCHIHHIPYIASQLSPEYCRVSQLLALH